MTVRGRLQPRTTVLCVLPVGSTVSPSGSPPGRV